MTQTPTRPTMEHLIRFVRRLISSDQSPIPVRITDETIQDMLDLTKQYISLVEMTPIPRINQTGVMVYDVYQAPWEYWENTVVLQTPRGEHGWQILTPMTANLLTGHWTLTTHQDPPVYITGVTYDVYAAAVNVLEPLIAAQGVNANKPLVRQYLDTLIGRYREKMRSVYVEVHRVDIF